MLALSLTAFLCALIPAIVFTLNLRLYAAPPATTGQTVQAVSILIPARNEAAGIVAAVQHALASVGCAVEVIVMDDASTDATAALVQALAADDARVRLRSAPPLPAGWNGKQHACWALAQAARHPLLCFVDADVRLAPECVARMANFLETSKSSLVSGFPRQVTVTTLEWLLLPLIHFVLLGFLPIGRMRKGTNPGFAAGCGQFMLVRAADYFTCGGHSGIKLTMHDGLRLPRLFRQHGLRTDLADITDFATCRMYTSTAQVWSGLAKNATEGVAAPARIVPITLLLLIGQVIAFAGVSLLVIFCLWLLLFAGAMGVDVHLTDPHQGWAILAALMLAIVFSWLPRILAARRFKQDWRSALLHPIGITLLLILQWYALIRQLAKRPVSWRDRAYVEPHAK